MPGYTSRTDMVTEGAVNGKVDEWTIYKAAPASVLTGVWTSYWKVAGTPAAGSDPATTPGTVYSSDASAQTVGAIWFPDRLPDLRVLARMSFISTQACTLMIYDRLVGVSGISLTTTGAKTVNSSALTRWSGTAANNNEAWLEVTTALTTTAAIVNLDSYTSADGTAAQSGGSVTFPTATAPIGTMVQLPLATNKAGIRAIAAGLNVGTASATGIVNVIIIRPIARMVLRANEWNEVSFLDDFIDLPQVLDNATIGIATLQTIGNGPVLMGRLRCGYG